MKWKFNKYSSYGDYRGSEKIEYRDLSDEQKSDVHRRIGVRCVLGLVGAVSLSFVAPAVLGHSSEERSDEDMMSEAATRHAELYANNSDVNKLSHLYSGSPLTYIDESGHLVGITDFKVLANIGGSGLAGLASRNNGSSKPNVSYNFSQSCLEGTGYDTTPSEIRTLFGGGDINAVAVVSSDETGDILTVSPASGLGSELRFERAETGAFKPHDTITAQTLLAHGCDTEYDPFLDGPRN